MAAMVASSVACGLLVRPLGRNGSTRLIVKAGGTAGDEDEE